MIDHDFEPVPGLPAHLPDGETLLWQGRPDWRALAVRAFHVVHVALYFALLAAWSVLSAWADGVGLVGALFAAAWVPILAIAAIVPLGLLAWLSARTTLYTITTKRLVLRIGVALPIIINVPFRAVESVGLRLHGDDTGDLAATLSKGYRLAFLVLWPHARPWHVASPQPMLRCVPDARRVARTLIEAMSAAADVPVRPVANDVARPGLHPVPAPA